jgi:hypothetical protein
MLFVSSRRSVQLNLRSIQGALPLRVDRILMSNTGFFFSMAWKIVSTFMKKKMRGEACACVIAFMKAESTFLTA